MLQPPPPPNTTAIVGILYMLLLLFALYPEILMRLPILPNPDKKVELYHSAVYPQLEKVAFVCLVCPPAVSPLSCVHWNFNLLFFFLDVHYKTGEPGSFCHSSITNGSFEGFNSTKDGTYHVESARGFSSKDNSPGNFFLPPWKWHR